MTRHSPLDGREWGHHLRMMGRLRRGISWEQAKSELDVILHTLGQIYAKGYDSSGGVPNGFIVNSLQSDVTRGVKPALLAVLGAVDAGTGDRLRERDESACWLAARSGAANSPCGRRSARREARLIRQLLTESLLLAALGGALGMLVAELGVRALVALSPPGLPRVGAIRLDGAVFAFGLGLTTLIGLAVGLIPALHASRRDLQSGLQQSSRRTAGGHQVTRRTLVVVGGRAGPGAAGERGTAVAQPAASVRRSIRASTRRTCSPCRCRSPATDTTTTTNATASLRRHWKRCARCPA